MKAIKVNKYLMPLLVVLTLLGSVWIAKAAGVWQTSGRGQVLLDESGQPDPAGIKGWMTLTDISETYGLPLDALYEMIGASRDVPPDTPLKDLEKLVPGMEVWAVREGVAVYLDGAWVPGDGRYGYDNEPGQDPTSAPGSEPPVEPTVAPTEATAVPAEPTAVPAEPTAAAEPTAIAEPTAAPESVPVATPASSDDHLPRGPAVGGGQGQGDGSAAGAVLPEDGSPLSGSQIKGRMTLEEIVDLCQVPMEHLIAELGLPEDVDTHLPMRDLASQLGIEVPAVREVVERYQAEH